MRSYRKVTIFKKIKSFIAYIFDKEIPRHKKILILMGFLYLLFPIDIIPDYIAGFGIIDDLTILFLIFNYYQNELERYDKNKYEKIKDKRNIIKDVDYVIKDDEERGE